MKHFLTLILPFFVVFTVSAQEKSTDPKGASVEGFAEEKGHKFAVLIGVNYYENLRKLEYAKNDVSASRRVVSQSRRTGG